MLETLLQRDRWVVALALIAVSLLSWSWLLAGAGMNMNAITMTRHSLMPEMMLSIPSWDWSHARAMFLMWWVMMIAMMLPSATPMILLAAALNRRIQPGQNQPYGSVAAFTSGYLLAWGAFSALATALQWGLQELGLVSGVLRSSNVLLSALLLMAAGAWQFTPWKYSCLRQCRAPVEFLTRHRRAGHRGALIMGTHHGLICLGCCWFLMVLLFVGGVMNLFWIAGLAIYVWVEKVMPSGETVSRAMGAVLMAWGFSILVAKLLSGASHVAV